ncbi:sigma-54 interaction domain-containing protein [Desulfurivibrio dismutans]|uniref:sigma-54 interaction domain-containing protein n=1 Tax=Desulfurivibrio dismutans TaxID=1398908 RepID=UPI0023DCA5B9|nr:sigma-54 dependent transcriptional regulator [Desulfurivibrio alkaliphilus]MDF1615453.1 sigma-54 dependent transcriptional regulator [Desulfurivibrio alkaliphilus]
MIKRRYALSLAVLVPLIFTGLNFVALSGAFYLLRPAGEGAPPPAFYYWTTVCLLLTILVSGLITWQLVRPMRRFASRAGNLPVLAENSATTAAPQPPRDELEEFNRLFDQVSGILSQLEADRAFPRLIGQSRLIRGVMAQMLKVAPTDTTVLITGETGTGKELVARGIVARSKRGDQPLVVINCAAIPEGLLESELFGHEKGAFTGAVARRRGKFEEADGGTVFLDEIGDMPLSTQAKLLRVLQEKVVTPVGGNRQVPVDVRLLAATHQDLPTLVGAGRFREDLYYRLNVFTITLPPLRLRREDIPPLAEEFIRQADQPVELDPEAMGMLMAHDWPGNIRELQNVVERALLLAEEGRLTPAHLPAPLRRGGTAAGGLPSAGGEVPPASALAAGADPGGGAVIGEAAPAASLDETLAALEKRLLTEALAQSGGIQVKAAHLLGIKERSLHHRLRKYGIRAKDWRGREE